MASNLTLEVSICKTWEITMLCAGDDLFLLQEHRIRFTTF